MKPIPLVRAATVASLADVLDAHGMPADRMLEQARIPLAVRENQLEFVPGRSVWRFVDEISRRGGPPDFLADIARLAEWRRARWVPPLAHATNLGDALRTMSSSWVREIPMVKMGLTMSGPTAWFWRLRVPDVRGWDGNEPAEQYTLSFMLEVIREAAGRDWLPPGLMVESPPRGWAAHSPGLAGIKKHHNQPLLAVAIPIPLLALPTAVLPSTAPGPSDEGAGEDFQNSLRQVLRASLMGELPNQEIFAHTLGMSSRSLRRRLMAEGTTWREVVHGVMFERASQRLLTEGISVLEVSQELGFSDVAHFSRFFGNRTGVAPSRWRDHVERAQNLIRNS